MTIRLCTGMCRECPFRNSGECPNPQPFLKDKRNNVRTGGHVSELIHKTNAYTLKNFF